MYSCTIHESFLVKHLFKYFAISFSGLFFLLLCLENSLYILDTSHFMGYGIWNCSFQLVGWLFIHLAVSLVLHFDDAQFISFSPLHRSCAVMKNPLPDLRPQRSSLLCVCVFSRSVVSETGALLFLFFFINLFYFLTLQYCIGFAIYQHDSSTGIHVFLYLCIRLWWALAAHTESVFSCDMWTLSGSTWNQFPD